MTAKFARIVHALKDLFEHPDAERPYLALADAYGKEGMEEEKEAVLFLVEKRFGREDDNSSNSHEKPTGRDARL